MTNLFWRGVHPGIADVVDVGEIYSFSDSVARSDELLADCFVEWKSGHLHLVKILGDFTLHQLGGSLGLSVHPEGRLLLAYRDADSGTWFYQYLKQQMENFLLCHIDWFSSYHAVSFECLSLELYYRSVAYLEHPSRSGCQSTVFYCLRTIFNLPVLW